MLHLIVCDFVAVDSLILDFYLLDFEQDLNLNGKEQE